MGGAIYIITGARDSGKTKLLKEISEALKDSGKKVSGIISEAVIENGIKTAYVALNVRNMQRTELCSLNNSKLESGLKTGRYYFSEKAFETGGKALQELESDYIIIDEIGRLELEGKGWAASLRYILKNHKGPALLAVKYSILEKIIQEFDIKPKKILLAGEIGAENLLREIL